MGKETLQPEEVRPKTSRRTQSVYLRTARAMFDVYYKLGLVDDRIKEMALMEKINGLKRQNPRPDDLKLVKKIV